MQELASPCWIRTRGGLCCFDQQKTQERVAQIAADLLAATKTLRRTDDQNVSKRRQWADTWMRHESLCFPTQFNLLLNFSCQRSNPGSQIIKQLEQILASPGCPGHQLE